MGYLGPVHWKSLLMVFLPFHSLSFWYDLLFWIVIPVGAYFILRQIYRNALASSMEGKDFSNAWQTVKSCWLNFALSFIAVIFIAYLLAVTSMSYIKYAGTTYSLRYHIKFTEKVIGQGSSDTYKNADELTDEITKDKNWPNECKKTIKPLVTLLVIFCSWVHNILLFIAWLAFSLIWFFYDKKQPAEKVDDSVQIV